MKLNRLWGLLALITLAGPSLGAEPAGPFTEHLQEAIKARAEGRLDAALDAMRAAQALRPQPELLNNIGVLLEELGRYSEAFQIFEAVASDPSADRALRALDVGRMAALQSKLTRGWLTLRATATGAAVYLDGAAIEVHDAEIGTGPGLTHLELRVPDSDEVVLRQWRAPVGRRTIVTLDLQVARDTDAWIELVGVAQDAVLTVDGQQIQGSRLDVKRLRVQPGTHEVTLEAPGFAPEVVQLELTAGESAPLVPLLRRDRIALEEAWAPTPWPWVVTAVGGAAALTGCGLLVAMAVEQADLQRALDEGKLGQGQAYALNADASRRGVLGVGIVAVGLAGATLGMVWGFLHAADAPEPVAVLPVATPGGLSLTVQGSF